MSLRFIHQYLASHKNAPTQQEDDVRDDMLINTEEECTNALSLEVLHGPYCSESKDFLAWAVKALALCGNDEERKQLIIGSITTTFVFNDLEYGTSLSKYTDDEITTAMQNEDMSGIFCFLRDRSSFIQFDPVDQSIKAAFFNVANFVKADPRGCDDLSQTLYLKNV